MFKTSLFLILLFLLQGCNFAVPFLSPEINQVTVVKYAPYFRHHRAYFTRNNLRTIRGKKYIFLHNRKRNELGVLLHYKDKYVLYNMSQPKQKPYLIRIRRTYTQKEILKSFALKGYRPVKSISDIGYLASVSHKVYKGVKTLFIEVKDYTRLQKRYKKAIKTHNPAYIKHIETHLPKSLIHHYYVYNKKRTKSKSKLKKLQIIGERLHIDKVGKIKKFSNKTSQKKQKLTPKVIPEPTINKNPSATSPKKIVEKNISISDSNTKPYSYYRYSASLKELSSYISEQRTKSTLSYSQYTALNIRQKRLKEEQILHDGTLEELIDSYKTNKKATFKARIMSLMKEKQNIN